MNFNTVNSAKDLIHYMNLEKKPYIYSGFSSQEKKIEHLTQYYKNILKYLQ